METIVNNKLNNPYIIYIESIIASTEISGGLINQSAAHFVMNLNRSPPRINNTMPQSAEVRPHHNSRRSSRSSTIDFQTLSHHHETSQVQP